MREQYQYDDDARAGQNDPRSETRLGRAFRAVAQRLGLSARALRSPQQEGGDGLGGGGCDQRVTLSGQRDALLRATGTDPKRVRVFESSEGHVYPLTRAEVQAAVRDLQAALDDVHAPTTTAVGGLPPVDAAAYLKSRERQCPAGHGTCPCLPGSTSEVYCYAEKRKPDLDAVPRAGREAFHVGFRPGATGLPVTFYVSPELFADRVAASDERLAELLLPDLVFAIGHLRAPTDMTT